MRPGIVCCCLPFYRGGFGVVLAKCFGVGVSCRVLCSIDSHLYDTKGVVNSNAS